MAQNTGAPKLSKKRKLGKGKKKSWRAANIDDIEEFLDDERRQQETGGLVSERSNEKLFFVDTSKEQKTRSTGLPISKADRRNRPLRSTALLEPSDHVKSAFTPVREDYRKGKRSLKILESLKERAASKVRVEAAQQRQTYVNGKRIAKIEKRKLPEVTNDLWNDDEMDTSKVKRPKRLMNKPSKLVATVVPHPGASVNPSYEDHQDLLQKALKVEETKKGKERKVANALRLPNKADIATKDTYFVEMTAGLIDGSDSENEVKEEQNGEVAPSVRIPLRKTKRQRKAEVKLGEQMRNKKALAEKNRRESMVFRIRSMKSEIRKQKEKEEEKSQAKLKEKEEEPFKTKRLGKLKFEEPPLELKLSHELVASMRKVKPEGDILADVYKNMMRRNVIEPRTKQKKKRVYKLKKYTKKTHKEPM